jgi:hypothetical protein
MRPLFILINTFLLVSTHSKSQDPNLPEALELAITIADIAHRRLKHYNQTTPPNKKHPNSKQFENMARKIHDVLKISSYARIHEYSNQCKSTTLAFTFPYSKKVYFCPAFFEKSFPLVNKDKTIFYDYPPAFAQTLIHEAAHSIGVVDECEVTRIELTIMRFGLDSNEAYHSVYYNQCSV